MNILSIQSHVAYGHVGNASAVFPMQRLGVEVWPIHTVQFSNHTGYGAWKGRVFDGPAIEELVDGIAERGVLPRCDGVLSGYMGSADIGNAILSAVARVRAANPEALYCCDPVIGDVGRGVFVRPGHPGIHARAGGAGRRHHHAEPVRARLLSGMTTERCRREGGGRGGPSPRPAGRARHLGCDAARRRPTPSISSPARAGGSGGCGRRSCRSASTARATPSRPCSSCTMPAPARPRRSRARPPASVYGLLKRTEEAGSREILTVAAQDEFVSPTRRFAVEEV